MLDTSTPIPSVPVTKNICACDRIIQNSWREKGREASIGDSESKKQQFANARAACFGDAVYEHEGIFFCVMHYPSKNKVDEFRIELKKKIDSENYNFCGVYFPEVVDFSLYERPKEVRFCFNTAANFDSATFSSKADFRSAKFCCEVSFSYATFSDESWFVGTEFILNANFSYAMFSNAAHFEDAKFKGTERFSNAKFSYATFISTAHFHSVEFIGVNFMDVTFTRNVWFDDAIFNGEALFNSAKFGDEAIFSNTTFVMPARFSKTVFSGLTRFEGTKFKNETEFVQAQFKDYVRFHEGNDETMFSEEASLSLDSLLIEKPERLSFHSVSLRPHWFINTDPRKFEFIDVGWDKFTFEQEREASKSDRLLSTAYRQLAMNAEENNRYIDATKFRYNSMDLRRLEKFNGRAFWTLDFWYWALSGYGERVGLATVWLLLILFLSCVPYWFTGFASSKDTTQNKIGAPIQVMLALEKNKAKQFLATLVYSLETASLQKPEPRPVTTMARLFVGLETILAPLQAALLVLAIRRKYMR